MFHLIINIYELTQKDNENDWLFEWKENKVLNIPIRWRIFFMKSLGNDFNSRWSKTPKKIDSLLVIPLKKAKHKLPNSNDFKGGIVKIGRNKC